MSNIDITNVYDILTETMSRDHIAIIELLSEPRHDEDIAGELNVKATIVRTLLNDLHAKSLVEYERTKNKKTGWYTYLWKKRVERIDAYIRSYLEEKLKKLKEELLEEKGAITFNCSCSRVPFEAAMENNFVCPKCNEKFVEFDNSRVINELEAEIERINALLG